MKSLIVKRSIMIDGHKTSVSLEDAFWQGLKEIASNRKTTLSELVGSVDAERNGGNLSSGLRVFVLDYYRSQADATTASRNADTKAAADFSPVP